MSDLMQLAYISKSSIQGDLKYVEEQIASILAVAQKKNAERNITGALLYSGGYFCQVLEGGEDDISELFETIQMDDRHTEVTVLHFEPLQERGFTEWAMAFAGLEASMRFDIEGIKASKDELQMRETGYHVASTLSQLVSQHQSLLNS